MRFHIEDRGDPNSKSVREALETACLEREWIPDAENPEIILCAGGDGTILRAIHKYLHCLENAAFVGVHTGTLGFLTDYTQAELDKLLADMEKEPVYETSNLLQVTLLPQDKTFLALNEVRIESVCRTLNLDVYIDNEFFEHTTGSGLCISTQAGSTAINRALGGAVIDSGLSALQLCEIMPISHKSHHSLGNPYIMKDNRVITIKSDNFYDARCTFDHLQESLDGVQELVIQTAPVPVRFARYRPYSYLKRLKNLY